MPIGASHRAIMAAAGATALGPNLFPTYDINVASLSSALDVSDSMTPISGFSNSVDFDGDTTTSTAYQNLTGIITSGNTYLMRATVEMTDAGGAPSFTGAINTTGWAFAFTLANGAPSASDMNVTALGGNVYLVYANIVSGSTYANCGVYQTVHTRQFKVSGYELYAV